MNNTIQTLRAEKKFDEIIAIYEEALRVNNLTALFNDSLSKKGLYNGAMHLFYERNRLENKINHYKNLKLQGNNRVSKEIKKNKV